MWVAVYVLAGWLISSILTAQVLAVLFRGASMGSQALPTRLRSIDLRHEDLVPMGHQRKASVIS
jgi:hypothetical protein